MDNRGGKVMKSIGLRIVAASCVFLSAAVIVNVVFLQGGSQRSETPSTSAKITSSVGRAIPGRKLVQAIQRELGNKGYFPRRADGRLDVVTRAAILAFETDNKLPLTADPSDQLLQSLLLGAAVEVASDRQRIGAEVPRLVRVVQHLLVKHGCGKPEKNGRIDGLTRAAIVRCQGKLALPTDGRISAKLVAKLQA